ncbi:hypothetical protein PT974_06468 [Cladobotryum mycophilum]|uniref:Uncharacterized protein n=1 Tax=Cladobotryum mycophilum TaxID=491253 RepID=A0ABR0SLI6_9HYPO
MSSRLSVHGYDSRDRSRSRSPRSAAGPSSSEVVARDELNKLRIMIQCRPDPYDVEKIPKASMTFRFVAYCYQKALIILESSPSRDALALIG